MPIRLLCTINEGVKGNRTDSSAEHVSRSDLLASLRKGLWEWSLWHESANVSLRFQQMHLYLFSVIRGRVKDTCRTVHFSQTVFRVSRQPVTY
jgi:hypothetical protein